MKKLLTITALIGVSLFLSNPAMAITGDNATGGARVIIDDSTLPDSGAQLEFDPSPGVGISWYTLQNSYSLTSVNASASDGNRNEYAIWSNYSGYYQAPDADSTDPVTDLTDAPDPSGGTTPFTGSWVAMGGGS